MIAYFWMNLSAIYLFFPIFYLLFRCIYSFLSGIKITEKNKSKKEIRFMIFGCELFFYFFNWNLNWEEINKAKILGFYSNSTLVSD